MFADLQDAMDWGLKRLGGNSFRIKYISIARVERDEDGVAVDDDDDESREECCDEDLLSGSRLPS
jgi:hypothetical protein